MQSLIRNYNCLQPGDQVLISDLEYDTVKGAMRWLASYRGVEVIEISHTHPASFDSLLQSYRGAFTQYPRLKLMALTYVTHTHRPGHAGRGHCQSGARNTLSM